MIPRLTLPIASRNRIDMPYYLILIRCELIAEVLRFVFCDMLEVSKISHQIPLPQYIDSLPNKKTWTFNVNPRFVFHRPKWTMIAVILALTFTKTHQNISFPFIWINILAYWTQQFDLQVFNKLITISGTSRFSSGWISSLMASISSYNVVVTTFFCISGKDILVRSFKARCILSPLSINHIVFIWVLKLSDN